MLERHVNRTDLIALLPSVIDDVTGQGTVYLVNLGPFEPSAPAISGLVTPEREVVFALGPPALLGQVLGLVDEEYGWPDPIQLADVKAVADLAPGPRRHPVLYRGTECIATSVSWEEYLAIRETRT